MTVYQVGEERGDNRDGGAENGHHVAEGGHIISDGRSLACVI